MRIFLPIMCCLILVIILFVSAGNNTTNEFLRIHIRANSNLSIDQNVKYLVKDAVVDAMIPLIVNCQNKEECIQVVENNIDNLEYIANGVLMANNYNYTCNAKICYEKFPTRNYGNLTLESGFYDALILELGEACGDNWWCVVYPPLCFINGSSNVSHFKSRIIEIIKNFGINL